MIKLITAPDGGPFDKEGIAKLNLGNSATEAELNAEENRLVAEWEQAQYQRDRQYPQIQEQLDMLYWDKKNGTSNWEEAIDAIKAEFPKPE